jgi:dTDP-4-amino-4,6-dideoxygalactose transaminase
LIEELARQGVNTVFHYVPLHSSPAGKRFGRVAGTMIVTDSVGDRLVRLPMWLGLEEHQDRVIAEVQRALG